MFGQGNAAATHLINQGVREGDLFLYFGWFRRVQEVDGHLEFGPAAQDAHVIFGWLQVGEIWAEFRKKDVVPKWARYHSHFRYGWDGYCNLRRPLDVVFVAKRRLELPGIRRRLPGADAFRKYHRDLCLSEPGRTRRFWRLPKWMYPFPENIPLSYHPTKRKWKRDRAWCYLQSADIGQEFVLDCDGYPKKEVERWLTCLFSHVV